MTSDQLPSFKSPPVIETVLGVQFRPIPGVTNAHLGAFWKYLGEPWDRVKDAPALEPVFEHFGPERSWAHVGVQLKLTQDPSTRVQIRNATDDRMIQAQNGRLHYNWLGQAGGKYPRYTNVRPEFDKTFERFLEFLKDESLEQPQLNQWEVTYINHLPHSSVWSEPADWAELFPSLAGPCKQTTKPGFRSPEPSTRHPRRRRSEAQVEAIMWP